MISFLHPILTVNLLLTGAEQQNKFDKSHEKVDASPAEKDVHHAGKRSSQIEAMDADESEEEAQQHGCHFALGVNLLLRTA